MTWFLAWTPNALAHGANPFYTTFLNYPDGINLAQNTTAPLLGLVTAPLTLLVSPIASYNLLIWLSFPLSAFSMYFVLRRFLSWDLAAIVGGAIYGFSPYAVAESLYHLNLCFVPLPPLIFLSVYELFRPKQEHPLRWGVALGLLVVGQFFISPEICATTMMMAAAGAVFLCIYRPLQIPGAIRQAWKGMLATAGITLVWLAYPIDVMIAGPYRYVGSANPGGVGADLLSPLLPTSLERFSFGHLGVIGSSLVFGNTSENGGFLGLPLLLLMVLILVKYWRRRWVRFSGFMALTAFILALGDHLDVDNHRTTFRLPFDLLHKLPIFNNILQVRIGLFVDLFAAFLVALGMDEMHTRKRKGPGRSSTSSVRKQKWPQWVPMRGKWPVTALMAVCIVSLIPSFPMATTAATVPAYFTTSAVDQIPQGSVVLMSPYPSVYSPLAQLWQAVATARFKIIGGYGVFSTGSPDYSPDENPPVIAPKDVQMYLTAEANGTPFQNGRGPFQNIPTLNTHLECNLRTWLLKNNVQTILSGPIVPIALYPAANPKAINLLFRLSLGPPSTVDDSITAWYKVTVDIARTTSQFNCASS